MDNKNLEKEIKGDQELYSYFVQRNVRITNFIRKILF
jgi:hypothetical protein